MEKSKVIKEIRFRATRSGGPGGQHANKVSTRVTARFDLFASTGLSEDEKLLIREKIGHRINEDGILQLSSDSTRSQQQNKIMATERLISLLEGALHRPQKRVPTKISKSEKMRRMQKNRQHAQKKALRRKPDID